MRDVQMLSADAMAGRAPGTPGDMAAQDYLIERMRGIGMQPGAADGSWRQRFDLVGIHTRQPPQWRFDYAPATMAAAPSLQLQQGSEFIVGTKAQQPNAAVADAELVFVGYGIQAPEYDWDDYKGVDLRGKVLVMLNNDPHWDETLFEGERRLYYGRWVYKYESAARQGAAGAIIIHTDASAGYPWQVVETSWTGPQFELPATGAPALQVAAWLTQDATRRLLQGAGLELDELTAAAGRRDFRPLPLGIRTSLALSNEITRVQSANVLGVLPGSDKAAHTGMGRLPPHTTIIWALTPNAGGDGIYNGARDNAAGMAQLLGIAQVWAALPSRPRRSLMLAFVGAEEQGLLGSEFFARNPPMPPGRIAANVNYDGGNIWGLTRDVTYIGYGKSTLDAVADAVAAHQGRIVKGDQEPDKGFFYRSDQLNFAKMGVPALYVKGGRDFVDRPPGWGDERVAEWTSRHYHQPSDEYTPDWNLDGMLLDARFGLLAGMLVANADSLPRWNQGDEFEAARLESLAQLGD